MPSPSSNGKLRSNNPRNFAPLPENELTYFLTSIAKTKGFYANLATTLCQDESFAEPKDQQCWNGERIAEYTKTVVDVGLDMQKYNPEVKPSISIQNDDPKVANLVDKLRRVHHMAVTSLGPNYSDADYMQRDGTDGSGSGSGPNFEEDDRDEEYVRGSGSGDGPGPEESTDEGRALNPTKGETPTFEQPPSVHVAGASNIQSPKMFISVMFIVTLLTTRFY